jgi:shikimate kinase/3-dehydroquinate synthase
MTMLWKTSFQVRTRVDIGDGVRTKLANVLGQLKAGPRVLLAYQPSTEDTWLEPIVSLLKQASYTVLPIKAKDGEACKHLDELTKVWAALKEGGFDRNDTIICLGGGALSDMVGFAAATYLRGLRTIYLPTTLLAQVDASLGGKTGINIDAGKNLIGSFYFPQAVIIDTDFLSTLPAEQLRSGLGEIVKYALIEDTIAQETSYKIGPMSLLSLLESSAKALALNTADTTDPYATIKELLPGIISACAQMKLCVVAKDPHESGLRRSLNLGHTLGHAIEKVSKYKISHGEAVSIGTYFALELANKKKMISSKTLDRIKNLLSGLALPFFIPNNLNRDELLKAMAHDKKRSGGTIKYVLPKEELGLVDYNYHITLIDLESLLSTRQRN